MSLCVVKYFLLVMFIVVDVLDKKFSVTDTGTVVFSVGEIKRYFDLSGCSDSLLSWK